jgi:DtxR family Mn-dependent transcriptional regulator
MQPMNNKKEEFLETLWHMHERGQKSFKSFCELLGAEFDQKLLDELVSDKLAIVDAGAGTITFTKAGEEYGRRLIRAHRLAERLIRDVLGRDAEQSACEFEHIVSPELVDGICTLLGHPRECPHGMEIPEGECCRRSATSAESQVIPVTRMEVGQKSRIAWVQCKNDAQMHKLEDMQLRPGVEITLHQTYPSFVIECEGSSVAFDTEIASRIRVWRSAVAPAVHKHERGSRRRRKRWGFWS